MHLRVAKCGHQYEAERPSGRARLLCERCTPVVASRICRRCQTSPVSSRRQVCDPCAREHDRLRNRARIGKRADGIRKESVCAPPGASATERFAVKVEPGANGCLVWIGSLNACTHGYGQFWDGTRLVRAHRWAWEQKHGPILDDLTVDHLCRNKRCVNVDHMELVTHSENSRRGRALQKGFGDVVGSVRNGAPARG